MKVEQDNPMMIWAAGILEGEGCFSIYERKSGKYKGKKELAIHCEMTDEDTILKLKDVLTVGKVYSRLNKRKDNMVRKPSWILSIQKQKEIFSTLILIGPYMSVRRKEKIGEMLDILINKFC